MFGHRHLVILLLPLVGFLAASEVLARSAAAVTPQRSRKQGTTPTQPAVAAHQAETNPVADRRQAPPAGGPTTDQSGQAGTDADPLVTRGYLDHFFRFRTIVIPAGGNLPLNTGAMLVFRSGRLKVRGPSGHGGLIDLTTGDEVQIDAFLPAHHLLLIPDSAGYRLEAQTLSVLLVTGLNAPGK
jgi:hypothetical protein